MNEIDDKYETNFPLIINHSKSIKYYCLRSIICNL